jgi:hypothetical protein
MISYKKANGRALSPLVESHPSRGLSKTQISICDGSRFVACAFLKDHSHVFMACLSLVSVILSSVSM